MIGFATIILYFSIIIQILICFTSLFFDTWSASELLSEAYLLSACLCFLSMLLDNRKGGVSYMLEFFFLFFLAVPMVLQIKMQVFPFYATLQPLYICPTIGLLALSHLSSQLGWQYYRAKGKARFAQSEALLVGSGDAKFYTKWAWFFATLATLLAVGAGASNLFVPRFDAGGSEGGGLTQQFLFMCRSLSLLSLVMLFFLSRFSENSKLKRANRIAIFLFLPVFFVINFPPALPRFVLFGVILALSTLAVDYFKPRNKLVVALASVATLFFVFPAIKTIGAGEFDIANVVERFSFSVISAYLLRVDFDGFMQITSTVEYVLEGFGSIRYGENFIGVLLFMVPRAIWPGKPIDTGEIVSTSLGFSYTNVSSPLPAEALMGFGIVGPIIVFFVLNYAIARIEIRAKASKKSNPIASSFFLYAISMGFIVIVMRGALNGVAPQFATAFLAFFVMQFIKDRGIVFKRKICS